MGSRDPCCRVSGRALAIALRTPDGPVTLEVGHQPERLRMQAWGAGAAWMEPRIAALVGLQDRPDDFRPQHPVVGDLWRRLGGGHLPRLPVVFPRIIQVVALQLVRSDEGQRSWRRLVWDFGAPAPGPQGLMLPPTPEALSEAHEGTFVGHGIPHKQARAMIRVARVAAELEAAAEQGPDPLEHALMAIRGVGPWTVQYVRGTALGDADAVLTGDYNLPEAVAWALARERRADDARMLELLEPFRGHRFRVIRLIWWSGKPPRTRPKRAMRLVEPFRRSK